MSSDRAGAESGRPARAVGVVEGPGLVWPMCGAEATAVAADPVTLPGMAEIPSPLIARGQIAARVEEIARAIEADHPDADELILIGVLKGSFIFLADLARALSIPHRIEFISISSYGDRESTESGAVRLILDVRHDIEGKHVIVVEDIVDTGHTLDYLLRLLGARRPASLRSCTLLRKPDRAQVDIPIDYLGFDIPDVWVVGYGLDFAERHRTLPDICSIRAPG